MAVQRVAITVSLPLELFRELEKCGQETRKKRSHLVQVALIGLLATYTGLRVLDKPQQAPEIGEATRK